MSTNGRYGTYIDPYTGASVAVNNPMYKPQAMRDAQRFNGGGGFVNGSNWGGFGLPMIQGGGKVGEAANWLSVISNVILPNARRGVNEAGNLAGEVRGFGNTMNGGYQNTRSYGNYMEGNANQAEMYRNDTRNALNQQRGAYGMNSGGQGGGYTGNGGGYNMGGAGGGDIRSWSPQAVQDQKVLHDLEKQKSQLESEITHDQAQYEKLVMGDRRDKKQGKLLKEIEKDQMALNNVNAQLNALKGPDLSQPLSQGVELVRQANLEQDQTKRKVLMAKAAGIFEQLPRDANGALVVNGSYHIPVANTPSGAVDFAPDAHQNSSVMIEKVSLNLAQKGVGRAISPQEIADFDKGLDAGLQNKNTPAPNADTPQPAPQNNTNTPTAPNFPAGGGTLTVGTRSTKDILPKGLNAAQVGPLQDLIANGKSPQAAALRSHLASHPEERGSFGPRTVAALQAEYGLTRDQIKALDFTNGLPAQLAPKTAAVQPTVDQTTAKVDAPTVDKSTTVDNSATTYLKDTPLTNSLIDADMKLAMQAGIYKPADGVGNREDFIKGAEVLIQSDQVDGKLTQAEFSKLESTFQTMIPVIASKLPKGTAQDVANQFRAVAKQENMVKDASGVYVAATQPTAPSNSTAAAAPKDERLTQEQLNQIDKAPAMTINTHPNAAQPNTLINEESQKLPFGNGATGKSTDQLIAQVRTVDMSGISGGQSVNGDGMGIPSGGNQQRTTGNGQTV